MTDKSSRTPLMAGNWKMNKTGPEARSYCERLLALLAEQPTTAEVAICPPFTPPAALISACARDAPRQAKPPQRAEGPLSGTTTPTFNPPAEGWARTLRGSAAEASAPATAR